MRGQEIEVVRLLETLQAVVIAANYNRIRESLQESLDSEGKIIAYHLSDGRKTEDILKHIKMSSRTLPKLWKQWYSRGFGTRLSVSGGFRFVRIFSLEDYGFHVPDIVEG